MIDRLCDRPESPWTDVFRGKAINDRGLAVRLTPYGIKSRDVKQAVAPLARATTPPILPTPGRDTCRPLGSPPRPPLRRPH